MISKFIDLKTLKVSDKGPGTIEGYRAVYEIDEGGDLLVKGAFADTLPDYLDSGFTAHSHQWNFSEAVGFPTKAFEDAHGLFVTSQFHTTRNAQDVRTIAKERMEAGKQVGFSFGYRADDYSFIQSKDYASELGKYIKPARLAANLAKARQFTQIRLLKKVTMIEDSLVTSPMNKLAMATGVKSVSTSVSALRLRSASLRLRAQALRTLYDMREAEPSVGQLRTASLRLRSKVMTTLYGSGRIR